MRILLIFNFLFKKRNIRKQWLKQVKLLQKKLTNWELRNLITEVQQIYSTLDLSG